jgi:SAM-dependent methyltransferase
VKRQLRRVIARGPLRPRDRPERFENEVVQLLAQRGERPPSQLFGDISDALWLWIHTEGYRRLPALRDLLPGLPEKRVQRHWTFRTGDDTLIEGFAVYLLIRELYQRHVGELRDAQAVLDFGCGYGRVIRFFLKDIDHRRLVGTDYTASLLDFCRASNRWCDFTRNDAEPPLPFEDNQFQYVFAYSVFSHLSEEMHLLWLDELRRVVLPGGAVAISVRPRNFINHLQTLRDSQTADEEQRILLEMLVDTERELELYDAGGFCYAPYSDVFDPWFGEACIPRTYIEREWSRYFGVVDFIEGSSLDLEKSRRMPYPACEQSVVLLKA